MDQLEEIGSIRVEVVLNCTKNKKSLRIIWPQHTGADIATAVQFRNDLDAAIILAQREMKTCPFTEEEPK